MGEPGSQVNLNIKKKEKKQRKMKKEEERNIKERKMKKDRAVEGELPKSAGNNILALYFSASFLY